MQCPRVWHLLALIAVIDCLIPVVVRPVLLYVSDQQTFLAIWQSAGVRVTGVCAAIILPLQGVAMWCVLRPQLAEQRRVRTIRRRVRSVLASGDIHIAFQPVACTHTGTIIAVEALSRFPGEPQQTPDRWFTDAGLVGLGVDLEQLAARNALTAAERRACTSTSPST